MAKYNGWPSVSLNNKYLPIESNWDHSTSLEMKAFNLCRFVEYTYPSYLQYTKVVEVAQGCWVICTLFWKGQHNHNSSKNMDIAD